MGALDFLGPILDPLQSLAGQVGIEGALAPGGTLLAGLAGGGSFRSLIGDITSIGGSQGGSGMPGALGIAAELAGQAANPAAAGGQLGAAAFVARATALNTTLGALLASNGIHPAPQGNIKATVVLLLRPDGAAFVDSVQRGTPDIMSRDMQVTKKTIKRIAKLARKIPRKTVDPSLNKQITDKVKHKIMQDIDCNNPLRITQHGGGHCG